MVMEYDAEHHRETMIGPASAKLTVPMVSLQGLRDSAELLHQLANALQRFTMQEPGVAFTIIERLGMAQRACYQAQASMRAIKARELAIEADAKVAEKIKAVPRWGVERKAG